MIDGHGNGRSKRSGTVRNDLERFGTIWNEVKNLVTGRSRHGHGHVTFSAINERFTVNLLVKLMKTYKIFKDLIYSNSFVLSALAIR